MKRTSTTSRGGIRRGASACSAFRALCIPALVAVLLAACSDTADDPERPSDDGASPAAASPSPTPAPTVEVASWIGDELPTAAGGMARSGDLGVYFAEVDHQYTLVAIDITTGAERWRQPVHQHGRIAGTTQTPTVDWDRGLVFATIYDYDQPSPGQRRGIVAFDLDDGDMQWGNSVGWARSTPELCTDDLVCVSRADGGRETFDRDTGLPRTLSTGGLERVIGGRAPWLIRADADARLVELGRTNADGILEQVWELSFAELFESEQAGATYSPNGAWVSHFDDDTGAAMIAFYAFTAEEVDDEVRREEAELGWAVSLVADDGEVRESWQQVDMCLPAGGWKDATIVLCEDLELVDTRVIEGEAQPFGHGTRVSGYRTSDGEQEWTTALPAPVESAASTGEDGLFVLRLADEDALVLDVDDGSTVALTETSELIVACEQEHEDADLIGALLTSDRELLDYRRAQSGDLSRPCDASGNVIDPATILETGELTPDWFGYRPHLEDDEEPDGADRWAVWVTVDGTLHGAGPAAEPR